MDREQVSRSRRIIVALFAALALALAVASAVVWESFQPTVIELPGPVEALALSADGSSVAACGSHLGWVYTTNGGVRNEPPRDALARRRGGLQTALAFAPGGKILVALDSDGALHGWSPSDGTPVELAPVHAEGGFRAASLSPAGDLVAFVTNGGLLEAWSVPEGKLRWKVAYDKEEGPLRLINQPRPGMEPLVAGPRFSPSGTSMLARRSDGGVVVLSTGDGKRTFEGQLNPTPEDLMSSEVYIVRVGWRQTTVRELRTERERYGVAPALDLLQAFAVSRDEEVMALGDLGIELRSAADGALLRKLQVRDGEQCTALAFSANRERLAAAFGKRIHVWRLRR